MRYLWTFLVLLGVLTAIPLSYGQSAGLAVEATADRDTVANVGKLSVNVKIRNEGLTDQHLRLMLCSYYDSWATDNTAVTLVPWPCDKNPMIEVVLKPGETYENSVFPLELLVGVGEKEIFPAEVSFRLGLRPDVLYRTDASRPVVWSNPLNIKITEH
jgi:hypothetical protein